MRIKIIRIIAVGLFASIAAALVYTQAIRGPYYYTLSRNNRIRVVPLEGWRGAIKDRNGIILADNRLSYSVLVTPQAVDNLQELFSFLAGVLDVDARDLVRTYQRRKYAPFAPVLIAEDVARSRAIIIEENMYRFPSLIVQDSFRRYYPRGESAAHVLGYVGKVGRAESERLKEYGYSVQSMIGKEGIENFYDTALRGGEGGSQIEVDSRGRQVRLLSLREPTRGADITLTIDSRVQQIATDLLAGRPGAVIVMEINSGEVVGMVSSPTYDPNIFSDSALQGQLSGVFSHPQSPLLNRVTKGLFPPGSVFKVPVTIAGLDTKKISQNTTFLCEGAFELGGISFGCTHVHGLQNLIEALAHSCNIYYYRTGLMVGAETISRYAHLFGLGRLTHIDLPYEKEGFIPKRGDLARAERRRWYTGDTVNLSIGQGDVLVTPIQIVRMMATVAREGVEIQPHLIKMIDEKQVEAYAGTKTIKLADPSTFFVVKRGLRAAVTMQAGTAHILDLPDLYVAGKTGTAQSSGDRAHHAWFGGYVRSKKNDLAFCVLLEHGGSSQSACELAQQLLLAMQKEGIL